MGFTGALLLAIVRLASAIPESPSEDAPLSDDELALLVSLTSTAAESDGSSGDADDEARVSTLARNLAEALDSQPSMFRTYRGRDHLTLIRDGVRLPVTHGFGRLRDGWLGLGPGVTRTVRWSDHAVLENGGLGIRATLDGPKAPSEGWTATVRTVARTADRGLGIMGHVGFGQPGRGVIVAGQFDTLPTLRLQSVDGAEDGDRLGNRWSVSFRAIEWDGAIRVGADWTRRGPASIKGPRPQEQNRLDHGLAFITIGSERLSLTAAYLRDELQGVGSTSTDRAQATLRSAWTLFPSLSLNTGIWAQYDDQTFADRKGASLRAEPWLSLLFSAGGFDVELTGKVLAGFVSVDDARQIEGVRPQAAIVASGPFAGGLGWLIALQLNSHLPQPWNIPSIVERASSFETSWGASAGPVWRSDRSELKASVFYQRVSDYWARPVVAISRDTGRFDVFGVEVDARWRPLKTLDLRIGLAWAEDILEDTNLEPVRPAGALLRGLASIRYAFAQRGFVEIHARWITDALPLGDQPRLNIEAGAPVRVGLIGGVELGHGLSLSVAVENVLDVAYDDPVIDRDQVGLDARLALTFSGGRP